MRRIFILSIIVVTLFAVLVTSCVSSKNAGNVLRIALAKSPTTLDPARQTSYLEILPLYNLPLMSMQKNSYGADELTQEAVADTATSADGLVWTLHLRPHLMWSDGVPLRAQDYVYGVLRVLDPSSASSRAATLSVIKGASEYNKGKAPRESVGIRAPDDATLEITLAQVTPWFPGLLLNPSFYPAREDLVKKFGDKYGTSPETLVSAGPFVLTGWVQGGKLSFSKNKKYWDAAHIKLERIEYVLSANEDSSFNLLKQGGLDLILDVANRDYVKNISTQKEFSSISYTLPSLHYMRFNLKNKFLANKNIRLAIVHAFDRSALLKAIYSADDTRADGLVPHAVLLGKNEFRVSAGDSPLANVNEADARKFLQLGLQELGLKSAAQIDLTLLIPDYMYTFYPHLGDFIQAQFADKLGIKIKINNSDLASYGAAQRKGDFTMSLGGWNAKVNDPSDFFQLFSADSVLNYGKYTNAEYEEYISRAREINDSAIRVAEYKRAEIVLLLEDPALLPLAYPSRTSVYRSTIKNYEPTAMPSSYLYKNVTQVTQ